MKFQPLCLARGAHVGHVGSNLVMCRIQYSFPSFPTISQLSTFTICYVISQTETTNNGKNIIWFNNTILYLLFFFLYLY